jgi:tetratricopeptide (TPR) repeat protein
VRAVGVEKNALVSKSRRAEDCPPYPRGAFWSAPVLWRFVKAKNQRKRKLTNDKFMNEKPKSIWKRSLTGWRGLLLGWLILMVALAIILLIWLIAMRTPVARSGDELRLFGVIGVAVTAIFLLVSFIRWLCCWRNFKRLLFGLACLATLIALFYAEEDWRGWHAWNQFKHEWEAKGEHFDFASVIPPAVPDDQNFALTPVVASCYESILDKSGHKLKVWNTNVVNRLAFDIGDENLNTNVTGYWAKGTLSNLKVLQEHYRELAAKTNLFAVPPQPQSPAADVLLALGKYDATVEDLRQAGQLPESRFPLNYDTECPAAILLPHLAALKKCSQVLQLRSLAELQNGQPEKALADVELALQLMDKIRTEFCLISHLVRIAMLQITLQPVWEGLAEHRWSDGQLVALDAELARLDFLADYKVAMRGEMGFQGGIIEYLRRHPEEILNLSSDFENNRNGHVMPLPAQIIWHMIPSGWFYQNRLRSARLMVNAYIPLADVSQQTISPAVLRHADEVMSVETKITTPYNILEKMMLPELGNCAKKFAYAQSSVDQARTAIALERYRLAHGEFPESLDALAPQFIAQVPHDVIGGQPLKYRRTSDGQFVLYSVGWNETDNGGVTFFNQKGSPDNSQGDWVWRYPAK